VRVEYLEIRGSDVRTEATAPGPTRSDLETFAPDDIDEATVANLRRWQKVL
jgi:hypothetical protein